MNYSTKGLTLYKLMKKLMRASLGGCCALCDYDKLEAALDIHHVDSKTKEYNFTHKSKMKTMGSINKLSMLIDQQKPSLDLTIGNWELIKRELKKCVLLCKNCHAEVHAGLKTCTDKLFFDDRFETVRDYDHAKQLLKIGPGHYWTE